MGDSIELPVVVQLHFHIARLFGTRSGTSKPEHVWYVSRDWTGFIELEVHPVRYNLSLAEVLCIALSFFGTAMSLSQSMLLV